MRTGSEIKNLEKGKLGGCIRQARIDSRLTHEQLSEMLGVSPTHLRHIESEHRKPSIDMLFKLSQILHLSLDSVFIPAEENPERRKLLAETTMLLQDCSNRELKAIAVAIRELHPPE